MGPPTEIVVVTDSNGIHHQGLGMRQQQQQHEEAQSNDDSCTINREWIHEEKVFLFLLLF